MVTDLSLSNVTRSLDLSPVIITTAIDEYILALKLDGRPKTTRDTYEQRLRDFCKFLTDAKLSLEINGVRKKTIQKYLGVIMERITRSRLPTKMSTVNAYYRALHRFFGWCVEEGYLNISPMIDMHPPKFKKPTPKPFTETDWENMLLLCSGNKYLSIRNRAIILMAFDTGLRLQEITGIKMQDFSLDTGLIHVTGKGDKERTVKMSVDTRKAVMRYMRYRNDNLPELWQTEEKTPLSRGGLQSAIERLCKRAGVIDAKPGPHTFRHSFAIQALINGADLYDIKELLGHTKISTTEIYLGPYKSMMAAKKHDSFSPVARMTK